MSALINIKQLSQKLNHLLLDLGVFEKTNDVQEKHISQWDPDWQIPAYIRRSHPPKQ